MATYPVKWFNDTQGGAPTIDQTVPGSFIQVLKACLVNGFNLQSVTGIEMDGTEAKISFGTDPGFQIDQIVLVEGADQAGYNGEHRVTNKQGGDIWVEMDNDPGVIGSGTTITCKAAPIGGWEITHIAGDELRAVFRSTHVEASGISMYVDDRGAGNLEENPSSYTDRYVATVRGVESLTDLDNKTGLSGDGWVYMGPTIGSYSRNPCPWDIIGDSRMIYFAADGNKYSSNGERALHAFGDINTYRPGDQYHFITVLSYGRYNTAYEGSNGSEFGNFSYTNHKRLARAYTQFPGEAIATDYGVVQVGAYTNVDLGYCALAGTGYGNSEFPKVNPVNNSIMINKYVYVREDTVLGPAIRGDFPGLGHPIHEVPFAHREIVMVDGDPWMAVQMGTGGNYNTRGQYMFNLAGGWR